MKNSPKRRCEKREIEVKGMFSSLNSLWVVILVSMLDIARVSKIYNQIICKQAKKGDTR